MGKTAGGEILVSLSDPALPSDRQIAQMLPPVSAKGCIVDVLTGIEVLSGKACRQPLVAGSKWTREFKSGKNKIRLTTEYVELGEVKVAAGSFPTHHFEVENLVISPHGTTRFHRSYWYAPSVRAMVIMRTQNFDVEGNPTVKLVSALKEFTPKSL
jgi:hypothetical protein